MKRLRMKKGFTLVELLVVIAIISMLAAILMPVLGSARESGRKATCQSNLKQLGAACLMYLQDYDETWIPSQNWDQILYEGYVKDDEVFHCPSLDAPKKKNDYGFNINIAGSANAGFSQSTSKVVSMADAEDASTNEVTVGNLATAAFASERHGKGSNILFCDGHVKWEKGGAATLSLSK